jgi:hypothetical protein
MQPQKAPESRILVETYMQGTDHDSTDHEELASLCSVHSRLSLSIVTILSSIARGPLITSQEFCHARSFAN